jgi:hypothetical protein
VGLSIPAVALFAFGQVVGDVRIMRNNAHLQSDHLTAMRAFIMTPSNVIALVSK